MNFLKMRFLHIVWAKAILHITWAGGGRMDLGWLDDYLALRELGSFTAAAERRRLSQPAFSRRIQALEAWLGVTLVDRSCRPPRFTPVAIENDVDLHRFLNQIYDLRSQLRGEQARASRLRVAVQH